MRIQIEGITIELSKVEAFSIRNVLRRGLPDRFMKDTHPEDIHANNLLTMLDTIYASTVPNVHKPKKD
jgi:hypothetical protein